MLSDWFSRTIQRFTNKRKDYFLSKINYTLSNKTPKFVIKPKVWFPLLTTIESKKKQVYLCDILRSIRLGLAAGAAVPLHLSLIDTDCRVWTLRRGRGGR